MDAAGRVFVTPQTVLPFGFAQTGVLFDMSMVSNPIPEADAAALALVAFATLTAIGVRKRRSMRV